MTDINVNFSITGKTQDTGTGRNSLSDKQNWSLEWEKAYLKETEESKNHPDNNIDDANQEISAVTQNDDNLRINYPVQEEISKQENDLLEKPAKSASLDRVTDEINTPHKLQLNTVAANMQQNSDMGTGFTNTPLINKSIMPGSIQSSKPSMLNMNMQLMNSEPQAGFHVFQTEKGEFKVWFRSRNGNQAEGLKIINDLKAVFSRLGLRLTTLILNGESYAGNDVYSSTDENTINS